MRSIDDFRLARNNHLTLKERRALGKSLLPLSEFKSLRMRKANKTLTASEDEVLDLDDTARRILAVDAVFRGSFPEHAAAKYGFTSSEVSYWCRLAKVEVPQEKLLRFVYCLRCPIDDKIRYVGISRNPAKRLKGHFGLPVSRGMGIWLRKLERRRLLPSIEILEQVESVYPRRSELLWIRRMFDEGHPLLNLETVKWRKKAHT